MAEPREADDPRMLVAQFELVQRELQRVERRLEALQDALVETQRASATLRGLGEATAPVETLVPIGAGFHLRARVDPGAAVLRPLGAGYAADDSTAQAQKVLEERAAQVQRSFQEASAEADRLAATAEAINERLSGLSQDS